MKNNKKNINELRNWFIISFIICLIVEMLSRNSFITPFQFMIGRWEMFLVNYMIILIVFIPTLFMKKKNLGYLVISLIIVFIGIADFMVNNLRGMPITMADLFSINEALAISNKFISKKTMLFTGIVGISLIGLIVYIWKKDKGEHRITAKSNILIAMFIVVISFIFIPIMKAEGIAKKSAWDKQMEYEDNGLCYSLVDSYNQFKRNPPEGYSKEAIEKIRAEVDEKEDKDNRVILTGDKKPNIVILQLEALMDPTRLKGFHFSSDPIPTLREISKTNSSGLVNAPTTGGGTARTEYEVLSGNSYDYLVDGEIAYQTFLKQKPSISQAVTMHNLGYKTHGIHNYFGNFYNRVEGYSNMGFDDFTPVEYMNGLTYTYRWWPKDNMLPDYIQKALKKTKEKDFAMVVSVQGHSSYPKEKVDKHYDIKVTADPGVSEEDLNQVQYYTQEVYEMDQAVKTLLNRYETQTKEPVAMILYGDHLPALDVVQSQKLVDPYETYFTYYSTYEAENPKINKDFQMYQTSTYLKQIAGQKYSPMEKIHAYCMEDKDYQKKLELVQYDTLFGKRYFLNDNEQPIKKHMTLGLDTIKIRNLEKNSEGKYIIWGDNFTRCSKVFIDGAEVSSKLMDVHKIEITGDVEKGEHNVELRMSGEDNISLGKTNMLIYNFK